MLIFQFQPGSSQWWGPFLFVRRLMQRVCHKEWFSYMVLVHFILTAKGCFCFADTISRRIFYHYLLSIKREFMVCYKLNYEFIYFKLKWVQNTLLFFITVFLITLSWWSFTGVWETASLFKSPGLFSGFWLILTML